MRVASASSTAWNPRSPHQRPAARRGPRTEGRRLRAAPASSPAQARRPSPGGGAQPLPGTHSLPPGRCGGQEAFPRGPAAEPRRQRGEARPPFWGRRPLPATAPPARRAGPLLPRARSRCLWASPPAYKQPGGKPKKWGGEKGGRGSRPRLRTHRVGRFHHVLDGTPHAGQAQPHGGPHHRQGRRSVRGRRRLGRRRRRRRQRLRPRPSPSAAFRQGPPRHGAGGGAGMAASGPPRWRWMWRASAVGTAAARFQGVLPEATQTNSAQKAQGRAVFY